MSSAQEIIYRIYRDVDWQRDLLYEGRTNMSPKEELWLELRWESALRALQRLGGFSVDPEYVYPKAGEHEWVNADDQVTVQDLLARKG